MRSLIAPGPTTAPCYGDGPGFSFPVWTWNGSRDAPAGREVSDAELSKMNATHLP